VSITIFIPFLLKFSRFGYYIYNLISFICKEVAYGQFLALRQPAAIASSSVQNQRSPCTSLISVVLYDPQPGRWYIFPPDEIFPLITQAGYG